MAEAINCPSCGASNQLPEGKNSMFCAFCAGAIEKKIQPANFSKEDNPLLTKPEISKGKIIKGAGNYSALLDKFYDVEIEGGELSLINRGLRSLKDITQWFSDNELNEITKLILSNNNIDNIDDIYRFSSLKFLDVSNNRIKEFAAINKCVKLQLVNLSGNDISYLPEAINLPKLEEIIVTSNPLPSELKITGWKLSYGTDVKLLNGVIKGSGKMNCKKCGQEFINYNPELYLVCPKCNNPKRKNNILERIDSIDKEKEVSNNQPSFSKVLGNELSGGKCFIATATMGSYDHPMVMELRFFRDNWILKKSWGERFVSWYYLYGAIAAKSIEKSFILKKICYLLIVKPLVYLSRIVKFKQ